jgi:hypothetical protein
VCAAYALECPFLCYDNSVHPTGRGRALWTILREASGEGG